MFKKSMIFLLICMLFMSVIDIPKVGAKEIDLVPNAKSAILIDSDTGTIIFEKNSNKKLPPASITKIMTMLLIMEAIDNGKITLKDKVKVSDYAASIGGSQIFLEAGEEMTVEDLLKGIALASGNDASVALAEYIAGSDELFVEMMNKKAKELGLKNTHFVNSNGLPAENHFSSAYDIAIMSKELLKYEKITNYTGLYQDYLRKNTSNPFWLVNTNKLVKFYQGVDGLKTGYTSEAKFCLAATAKKGTFRIIAVVMGEPNTKTRNKEVTQLLNYAFSQYINQILYKKSEKITAIEISKGKEETLSLIAPQQISLLMKKGESSDNYEQKINLNGKVTAPVKKGEVLANIEIFKDGEKMQSVPLIAEKEIKRGNLLDMLKIAMKQFTFANNLK